MIVITYGTKIEGYLPILISQCNKLNLNLKILGEGKKWEGFFQRTLDYYDYLKTLDSNELCIFIDGYDTIPLEDEEKILEKYNSFNKPIVWGVDLSRNLLGKIFFGSTDILINGGSYMGKCSAMIEIFEKLIDTYGTDEKQDDQQIINEFYLKNKDYFNNLIGLDMNSIIFANADYIRYIYYITNNGENIDYYYNENDKKIYNKETNIPTSFLSGPGCINLDKMVNKLGYEFFNTRCENYWQTVPIYLKVKEYTLLFIIIFIFIVYMIYYSFNKSKNYKN